MIIINYHCFGHTWLFVSAWRRRVSYCHNVILDSTNKITVMIGELVSIVTGGLQGSLFIKLTK